VFTTDTSVWSIKGFCGALVSSRSGGTDRVDETHFAMAVRMSTGSPVEAMYVPLVQIATVSNASVAARGLSI
jgi:hypothetical protein